jgi:hypothetical protein
MTSAPSETAITAAPASPDVFPGLVDEEAVIAKIKLRNVRTLRDWFRRGGGPARVTLGRRHFYRTSELNRWLESVEAQPKQRRTRRSAA